MTADEMKLIVKPERVDNLQRLILSDASEVNWTHNIEPWNNNASNKSTVSIIRIYFVYNEYSFRIENTQFHTIVKEIYNSYQDKNLDNLEIFQNGTKKVIAERNGSYYHGQFNINIIHDKIRDYVTDRNKEKKKAAHRRELVRTAEPRKFIESGFIIATSQSTKTKYVARADRIRWCNVKSPGSKYKNEIKTDVSDPKFDQVGFIIDLSIDGYNDNTNNVFIPYIFYIPDVGWYPLTPSFKIKAVEDNDCPLSTNDMDMLNRAIQLYSDELK